MLLLLEIFEHALLSVSKDLVAFLCLKCFCIPFQELPCHLYFDLQYCSKKNLIMMETIW